jgi:hypothetical protein
MARRGIEGTGGFSRSASLKAISVNFMASIVEIRRLVGGDAERHHFFAQLGLPLRIGGKRVDKGSQRRRQRVVRGHHQKAHMVDDILGRQQRAVLMGGAAQLREQVFAAFGAADRNLLGEIGNDTLATLDAARHRGAGQRPADHGDRGGHHVDKGAGDLVDLGPDSGAEKGSRGQVERKLLHGGIEQDRPRLRLP